MTEHNTEAQQETMAKSTSEGQESTITLSWEWLGWIAIMIAALISRTYQLGLRSMSHDESLHTFYSWKLFDHMEYVHDPMMHGPLLYHGTALSYWIFGDNDFGARMFTVVLGLLLIMSPLLLKKWLGRFGAMTAGLVLLISPTVMYYTRYIRHDIHVELFTVAMFIGFVRYLDSRESRWVVLAFAAAALAIASAEMTYINGFALISVIVLALLASRVGRAMSNMASIVLLVLSLLAFFVVLRFGTDPTPLVGLGVWGLLADDPNHAVENFIQTSALFAGLFLAWAFVIRLLRPAEEEDADLEELALSADESTPEDLIEAGPELPDQGFMSALSAGMLATSIVGVIVSLRLALTPPAQEGAEEAAGPGIGEILGRIIADPSPQLSSSEIASRVFLILLIISVLALLLRGLSLADVVVGRFSTVFLGLGVVLPIVGLVILGGQSCSAEAVGAGRICETGKLLVAAGAVFLLYGLIGWLLADAKRGSVNFAIGRLPLETLLLSGAVAFLLYSLFYTTLFTNPGGFAGMRNSIEYWLDQHGVERGSQPWYYYGVIAPLYEFLPLVLTLLALRFYTKSRSSRIGRGFETHDLLELPAAKAFVPSLIGWTLAVIWIYSWAGEKMPWLTLHLVVPMAFLVGRYLQDQLDRADLPEFGKLIGLSAAVFALAFWSLQRLLYLDSGFMVFGGLLALILPLALAYWIYDRVSSGADWTEWTPMLALWIVLFGLLEWIFGGVVGALRSIPNMFRAIGANPILIALALLAIAAVGALIYFSMKLGDEDRPPAAIKAVYVLGLAGLLFVVNTFYSLQANFPNAELATEYIVYAHGTDDNRIVFEKLKEINDSGAVGEDLRVGYDNEVSWPFTWYFRDESSDEGRGSSPLPGARYLGDAPSGAADLKQDHVVLVGSPNYGKFEDYLKTDFIVEQVIGPDGNPKDKEYDRMWWPNEGYKGFTLSQDGFNWLKDFVVDDNLRRNLLDISIRRKYDADPRNDEYEPKSLDDWYHHAKMKMWVRKDVAGQFGIDASAVANAGDDGPSDFDMATPLELDVEQRYDGGSDALLEPKGIALDAVGNLYVVDHGNKRVQVFDPQGGLTNTIQAPGLFEGDNGNGGLMPSAWGIEVDADGAVYVADTWAHKIRKFVDGEQVLEFGEFGQPENGDIGQSLNLFYGPRDVALDAEGRIYVADTGNKRISVFNPDGEPIFSRGGAGLDPGQMNEPSSVAIDPESGFIYVADLWNLRVQVFDQDFNPLRQWRVDGWESQDALHKAYVDAGPNQTVVFSDPSKSRVWVYSVQGEALGRMGLPMDSRGMDVPIGIAVDSEGRIYVSSNSSSIVTRYAAPSAEDLAPPAADSDEEAEEGADSEEGSAEEGAEGSEVEAGAENVASEEEGDAVGDSDSGAEDAAEEDAETEDENDQADEGNG